MHITNFDKTNILVVGDVILDSYFHGNTTRISPEAPVPIVHVKNVEERAGGAANVALNVNSLGGKVKLLGYVGDDKEASKLENLIKNVGIESCLQRIQEVPTINKLRIIGRNQQLLRVDFEETFQHVCDKDTKLFDSYIQHLPNVDLVILSDYGKGTLHKIRHLIKLAKHHNKPILIDPKGADFEIYRGATVITPNLNEFEKIVGPCLNEKELEQKAESLRKKYSLTAILVTRGEHGMSLICEGQKPLHIPARVSEIYDVTGAGDTVIATLGIALASGLSLEEAVILSNTAAGIVVRKLGAATASLIELQNALSKTHQTQEPYIVDEAQLLNEVTKLKDLGEKIVMTNGCFDILHAGHIAYLSQAKSFGDKLIVAVNDDNSIKRLKGNERPINPLLQRMQMLAALKSVDFVVPFSSDTPENLITRINPHILVKGGDYKIHEIAGADFVLKNGGEVKIVPFVEGLSTSKLINKIKLCTE